MIRSEHGCGEKRLELTLVNSEVILVHSASGTWSVTGFSSHGESGSIRWCALRVRDNTESRNSRSRSLYKLCSQMFVSSQMGQALHEVRKSGELVL